MTPLLCRLGRLTSGVVAPPWAQAGAVDIPAYFAEASGNSIGLQIDTSPLAASFLGSGYNSVGSYDLHSALRSLVGPSSSDAAVNTIGVLFAAYYRYAPTAFGVMFDVGFDLDVPAEGSSPILAGRPREGCAVFLGAIADARSAGTAAYEFQALLHDP